jgi:cell division protein FtsZ
MPSMMDHDADNLKFDIQEETRLGTRIRVLGVGGGGSNAVARMMEEGVSGVDFYVLNTDLQALEASPVPNKLAIGRKLTGGLGAGSNPAIGREAALEDTGRIVEILEGADMVFVAAGMGGGTGTGAGPVVASLAKELGALTVAIVTCPFAYEGSRRMSIAEKGLEELAACVDTVITIPNQKLLTLVPRGTSFVDALRVANDVLKQAVQGISDIIVTSGVINRDFADIKATMGGMGFAMMGTAMARGENAALEAARKAINSPLLDDAGIQGARALLINVTGSSRLGLHDVDEACALIRHAAGCDDSQINFGIVVNETMEDNVKVSVIATGFPHQPGTTRRPAAAAPSPVAHDLAVVAAGPSPALSREADEQQHAADEVETPAAVSTPVAAHPHTATPRLNVDDSEEDDLDIPAYVRRGKFLQ